MLISFNCYFKNSNKKINLLKVVIVILNAQIIYLNNNFFLKKDNPNKFCNFIVRINKNKFL